MRFFNVGFKNCIESDRLYAYYAVSVKSFGRFLLLLLSLFSACLFFQDTSRADNSVPLAVSSYQLNGETPPLSDSSWVSASAALPGAPIQAALPEKGCDEKADEEEGGKEESKDGAYLKSSHPTPPFWDAVPHPIYWDESVHLFFFGPGERPPKSVSLES